MFIKTVGEVTRLKHIVYLSAATLLGLLLSFLVHAFIEMEYLSWAAEQGKAVTFYGSCALPTLLQLALWVAGGVGGFYLGRFWWRMVYIDRVWARVAKPPISNSSLRETGALAIPAYRQAGVGWNRRIVQKPIL